MIASALVAEVQRLLTEGNLSQRAIARLTGISRGTVDAIASGRRPDYEIIRHANNEEESFGPLQRCPSCGGVVYMPCRLCRVRQTHAIKPSPQPRARFLQADERPGLELRPEHRVRYDQVRAWRQQASKETVLI